MKLVNLTPHTVSYVSPSGSEIVFEPVGLARVEVGEVHADRIGIDNSLSDTGRDVAVLIRETFGDVTGLPAPVFGTLYIVSRMVMAAAKGRSDLVAPARLIRISGRIVGCSAFAVSS